jgi:hypothetical protein
MFYVLVFSLLAVVLIMAGVAGMKRRQGATMEREIGHATTHAGSSRRRTEKAKRAQSRHDRRKRH